MPKAPAYAEGPFPAVEKVAFVTFSKVPWPPRSESQALLRKAFFAFAAHSQGGFRQAARSIRAANPAGRGAHPAGRGAAAFGGRGPLAPGLPNQMAGAGDFGPRPSHLRALRALPPPPRLANRQTPMRAGAAGPALCALRPPYSSGQTYRPLPLVFSPYWMAWTGQRLMQLVQR